MSCCEVSMAPQLPSPARYTPDEPGWEIAEVATLQAVEIVPNFVSEMAAQALMSALTIVPSKIFVEVTAPVTILASVTELSDGTIKFESVVFGLITYISATLSGAAVKVILLKFPEPS